MGHELAYSELMNFPLPQDFVEGRHRTRTAPRTIRQSASRLLWMSSVDRDALAYTDTPDEQANLIIARAKRNTRTKLHHIDLTLAEYFSAYRAFGNGDTAALDSLREVTAIRQKRNSNIPDTKSQFTTDTGKYTTERIKMHNSIAQFFLKNIPLNPQPRFIVVPGGFGSGKSEILRNAIRGGDKLYVSDPDAVRPYLMQSFIAANHHDVLRTNREVADVSDLTLALALKRGVSIMCETTLRDLTWWDTMLSTVYGLGYQVEAHVATRSLQECFRRVIAVRDRPARVNDYLEFVKRLPNFIKILDHPAISKVSITHLMSPGSDAIHPADCALTGRYVKELSRHPRAIVYQA